jgi:hypothetical protein
VGICAPKALLNVRAAWVPSAGSVSADFGTLRPGDANEDNRIDILDFSALARAFGRTSGQEGFDTQADFNNDDKISILDFTILAVSYGQMGDTMPADASGRADLAGLKPAAAPEALYALAAAAGSEDHASPAGGGDRNDGSSPDSGGGSGCNGSVLVPGLLLTVPLLFRNRRG